MKRVLIVDDDESIVDALTLVLEDAGYIVGSITNGEKAFTKALSFKSDIILLDVLMSGIDGRDICKTLKKHKATKDIPIIMISALPNAGNTIYECGAIDFLAKPFETDELLKKIEGNIVKAS